MKRREAGLTKVEFIVVLLLMLVLVVVVAPIASRSGYTRRTQCMNNLRQLGLVMFMYARDYNDRFPSCLVNENEPTQHRLARLMKLGYLQSYRVFCCPSNPPKHKMEMENLVEGNGKKTWLFTEATLESLAKNLLGDDMCSYGVDSKVNHEDGPTRAVLADRPDPKYWGTGVNSPAKGAGSNSDNHKGEGQNVFFNDGHVKWCPTVADDAGVDPNIYADNPDAEVNQMDDANIDFGKKP